jgi:hypothetical protein
MKQLIMVPFQTLLTKMELNHIKSKMEREKTNPKLPKMMI